VDIERSIGATIDVQCGAANPGLAPDVVPKRNSGRRARSRKRRPAPASAQVGSAGCEPEVAGQAVQRTASATAPRAASANAPGKRVRPRGAAARAGEFKDPQSLGERPPAPWHPLPLSELLILIGAIGVVVGLSRATPPTFIAGIAAVVLGTAEVTWREHRSGYRSHTLLLALLPTIVFHSALVLALSAFVRVPRAVNLVLLPLDGAVMTFLFKLLRAQFQDARRERRFAGAR
jgi:hypothetical protein